MDDYLASVYYDPKRSGGFGGVDRLYKDVKKEGKFNIGRTKIKEWLMKQDAYTLHKPIRRHFKRNRVIVGDIDQQWEMDLADMQSIQKFNDGYRYLLACIDVFSKYAWVVPLKNKKGPSLVGAFKIILASGRKPEKIITDQGTEFFNKHFKALLKDEASVCLSGHVTDLGYSYNHTIHRSIKKKPVDVTVDNEKQVWHTLYDDRDEVKHVKYKFNIGDQVRISKNVRLKKDTYPTSQKRFLL